MTEYSLVEPNNMQRVKDSVNMSLTPALSFYKSVNITEPLMIIMLL